MQGRGLLGLESFVTQPDIKEPRKGEVLRAWGAAGCAPTRSSEVPGFLEVIEDKTPAGCRRYQMQRYVVLLADFELG